MNDLRLFFESAKPKTLKDLFESLSEESLGNLIEAAIDVQIKSLRADRFQRCLNLPSANGETNA